MYQSIGLSLIQKNKRKIYHKYPEKIHVNKKIFYKYITRTRDQKITQKKAQENPSFGTCFHTNFQFKFHNYDWYKIGTNYRTNFESNNKHSSLSLFFWTLIFLPTCMIFIIFFSFIQITWFVFYNFSQDV